MKADQEIIGTAIRVEYDEINNKLFLVFEITSEIHKKNIKTNWTDDIEYKLINKSLIINEDNNEWYWNKKLGAIVQRF